MSIWEILGGREGWPNSPVELGVDLIQGCERVGDGLHWLHGKKRKRWARDGEVGRNGNDLMTLIIVFDC